VDAWLERLSDDPVLAFVAWVVVALVTLVTLNILWLMGRALAEARVERVHDRFWATLGKDLVIVIGDPAREAAWIAAARRHPVVVLRRCLDTYMTRTSGDFREGLARVYGALGLLERDLALLGSWRWGVRMRALRRLATVVTSEHRAHIARLVSESGEIRLLVGQIMGRIGTPEDVIALLSTWRITSRLSEYPVHVMVDAMTPEALRAVLPAWDRFAGVEIQRIVLGTAARVVPGDCQALLAHAARHASMEIRIAACHAGARMATPATLELLVALAKDATWEVRAQAVKALGAHRGPASAEVLAAALGDASVCVRQNAAAALGAHGPDGIKRPRDIAARAGDRYARDAADHVLSDLALTHAPPPGARVGAPA